MGTQPVVININLGWVLLFSPEVRVGIGTRVRDKARQGPGESHLHSPVEDA